MGFFSDLKEDLSQAVNELMPEEQLDAVMAGSEEKKAAAAGETVDTMDLGSMLDKLEEREAAAGSATSDKTEKAAESIQSVQSTQPFKMPETVNAEKTQPVKAAEPAVSVKPAEPVRPAEPIQPISPAEPVKPAEPAKPVEIPRPVQEEKMQTADLYRKPERKFGGFAAYQNNQRDGKKMDTKEVMDETAIVTAGMSLTGDIVSKGSLELIGTVNGNIDILGKLNITGTVMGNSKAAEIYAEGAKITGEINSQGSVKIGQSSVVIGNISATSAVIAGAVKGDIDVHGPVILDTSAIVMGNIKSKSVQINNGAVIEGMCSQCYADVNPTSFFEDFKKKK